MFIERCIVHWALSELSFSEAKDLFSMLNVMENAFHFSHRIYCVLLLKSVITLFFLPNVFILFSLYFRLFWSRLLFSFSSVINRADFTPFMPMLNLPHLYFSFQFIRQLRSLVTIASYFLEALRHGARFIPGVFSIDTKLLQEWIIFMFTFIWSFSSDTVHLYQPCNTCSNLHYMKSNYVVLGTWERQQWNKIMKITDPG